jgi:hypothetical protein
MKNSTHILLSLILLVTFSCNSCNGWSWSFSKDKTAEEQAEYEAKTAERRKEIDARRESVAQRREELAKIRSEKSCHRSTAQKLNKSYTSLYDLILDWWQNTDKRSKNTPIKTAKNSTKES